MRRSIMMSVCALAVSQSASAEWINRYPRVSTLPLQVYLEGYNLPTFATSPTDPAPSPDGRSVAFATREARRVTRGASIDARPAWSPDGQTIAFMRDSGRDTGLWLLDLASGRERVLVDTPTIELDPAFSPDGKSVYYSSAEAGDLDIWRIDLASGAKTRLTTAKGQEINPQPVTMSPNRPCCPIRSRCCPSRTAARKSCATKACRRSCASRPAPMAAASR